MTELTPRDWRMAGALWLHYARCDWPGVDAVIAEAAEADRLRELAWALPGVLSAASDPAWWHSDDTIEQLRANAAALAAAEHTEARS